MYIELKNINKSFGDFQASKDVNFAIEKGKLVGLLGPSGSGKTTIFRRYLYQRKCGKRSSFEPERNWIRISELRIISLSYGI